MEDITTDELKSRMDKGEKLNIIDVREPYEDEEFNIGAKLIPLATLPEAMFDMQDLKEKELIVHCRSGARSATAKAKTKARRSSSSCRSIRITNYELRITN